MLMGDASEGDDDHGDEIVSEKESEAPAECTKRKRRNVSYFGVGVK